MKPTVFIHTNHRQLIGALVSAYSMARNSAHGGQFDVRLIELKDHRFFQHYEGKEYLRDGIRRLWRNDDLQSFTPLRFMPPALMGYQGRAIVVDPDVFAVGDVYELLSRDMQGKGILCRARSGAKGRHGFMASSVMLLDCGKLQHWRCQTQFAEMFDFKRDYMEWIGLKLEPPETLGLLESEWNDFDRLTPATKLLHNTKRKTQPWKTGLPVDFIPAEKTRSFPLVGWVMRTRRVLFGDYGLLGRYRRHPDVQQERFFFGLLRECLEKGVVTEDMIKQEMRHNHMRHDALELIDKTPPLIA